VDGNIEYKIKMNEINKIRMISVRMNSEVKNHGDCI